MERRRIVQRVLLEELSRDISTLTSSSSSSDSSDDSSDFEYEVRQKRIRIQNFVEEIARCYNASEFKSHFRMSRCTVEDVIGYVAPIIQTEHKGGWAKISAEKAVLTTLWYLANQETFRQISDRFDITLSAAHNIVTKVTTFFYDNRHKFIKWPAKSKYGEIANRFEEKQGIKNVIGAIDGTHIPVKKFAEDSNDFINRKGFCSILLQGVADCNRKFINIYCGEPGSIHDARLLRKSELYRKATADPDFFNNYFLLGDSAYPSLSWLVPPYKDNGHLDENQLQFNFKHSSTRMIIENSFGLLKGRFRRLKKFDNNNIEFIIKCVVTACAFHNICLDQNDTMEELVTNDDEESNDIDSCECIPANGEGRREAILNYLFENN